MGSRPRIPDLRICIDLASKGRPYSIIEPYLFANKSTRGVWHCKYRIGVGQTGRKRFSCSTSDKEAATQFAKESLIDIVVSKSLGLGTEKRSPLISKLKEEVINEKRAANRDSEYIGNIEGAFDALIRKLGDKSLASISRQDALDFINTGTTDNGYMRPYMLNHYKAVRMGFNIAIHCGYLSRNPFAGLSLPELAPREIQFLTQAEFLSILRLYPAHSYQSRTLVRALIILYFTGLRPSQLRTLHVNDINLQHGTLTLKIAKGKKHKTKISTYIKLNKHALRAFADQLDEKAKNESRIIRESKFVFATDSGKLAARTFAGWFEPLKKNWPHKIYVDLYSFRHGLASLLGEAGLTDVHISRALCKTVGRKYTHLHDDRIWQDVLRVTDSLDFSPIPHSNLTNN